MSTVDALIAGERIARQWLKSKGLSFRYQDRLASYLADVIDTYGEAEAVSNVETLGREAVRHTWQNRR